MCPILIIGQNIDVNNDFINQLIRYSALSDETDRELSFNIRPLNFDVFEKIVGNQYKTIYSNKTNLG